ncbi:hypothetical protein DH2020_021321 [Rehmannia glutinosa]|uniref:Uncharacterized protein n=1 Tax=Rehmannia glutinosa TaxID=99300 RepID=A0ABR0WA32_REHGL
MRSDVKNRTTVNSTVYAPFAGLWGYLKASEHVLDLASPCCTSNESSCFKENININKSENPKLCLEPLQMKRKKKGGGYNLRKSLAWDKAFFTEEGVLDPLELSVISGASCKEGLPFINGDTPGSPQLPIKPVDLQNLEKNLLKEMQDEDLGKDRKKDWSSPKLDSSSSNFMTSTSLTSHKLPTHLGSKSGSRCGDCPRPLPSSSYPLIYIKKAANVNVGKAAGKELKLPKVPGLKPSLSPIRATTRSTILKTNCVTHNQITKPDFNIQRNAGLNSSSNNLQNTQSASKSSSLQSARYSDGNLGNSSFKRISSVNMSPILVDNADNSGSKRISNNMTPARPMNSSEGQHESTSFATSFSRNFHVGGTTTHPSQNQTMKPSGLRMPSPSLSFFSQPKRSVFHDLSLRDKETDVCGSQKPEFSRLKDHLTRKPKMDNKIPASTISSSKAINPSSECMASSHVRAVEVIKPNLEQNPMQKIPDIPNKNRNGRINHEERELQKIGNEVSSVSGSREQVMDDKFFKNTIDGYVEEACKPDCYVPHREQTDPSRYSLGETGKRNDKDKNVRKTKERASEQLSVSQQNDNWHCGSASIEALEHRRTKAEISAFESKHLQADHLKETAFTELSADILTGEVHMLNAAFAPTIGGCKNDINLASEVADDTEQSGKDWLVQNICLKVEMEQPRNDESNSSDRLLAEKQICLQNSHQVKDVEKLVLEIPDRKDENMVSSLSPGKMHAYNFDKDEMTGQPLLITEFSSVDNSLSSETHNSLIDASYRDFKGNANVLLNSPANGNLSNSPHQDIQRTEINYCSSFLERTHEGSLENTPGKVTAAGPVIQDCSAKNQLTSTMILTESESDMDNLRNVQDSRVVLVQSLESNMLNECYYKQSERVTLPSAEFVAENLAHSNDGSHFENYLRTECPADVSYVENALGITEGSVTSENKINSSILRSSSFCAIETHLEDENCSDEYGTGGCTAVSKASEDTNSSFSCLHPKLDHAKVEAPIARNNKHGDDLSEKSCSPILPQNAIPFSDEWLAAIEAAGENDSILTNISMVSGISFKNEMHVGNLKAVDAPDILTRKSGAVQNSPPDKSLPEPGPWSKGKTTRLDHLTVRNSPISSPLTLTKPQGSTNVGTAMDYSAEM